MKNLNLDNEFELFVDGTDEEFFLKKFKLVMSSFTLYLLKNGDYPSLNLDGHEYLKFSKLAPWDEYDCEFSKNFIVCATYSVGFLAVPNPISKVKFATSLFRFIYKLGYSNPYMIERLHGFNDYNPSRIHAVIRYDGDIFAGPGKFLGYSTTGEILIPDLVKIDLSGQKILNIVFKPIKDSKGNVLKSKPIGEVNIKLWNGPFTETVHIFKGEDFIEGKRSRVFLFTIFFLLLIIAVSFIVFVLRRGFKRTDLEIEKDMIENSMYDEWVRDSEDVSRNTDYNQIE